MLTLMALIACGGSETPDATPWLGAWFYPTDIMPEVSCLGRSADEWGISVGTWEGTLTVEETKGKLKATVDTLSYACSTNHIIPEESGGPASLDAPGQDCALVDDPGTLLITWNEATLTPFDEGYMRHKASGTLDVFGTACEVSIDFELTEPVPVCGTGTPDTGDTGDTGPPGGDTGAPPSDSGDPEEGSR